MIKSMTGYARTEVVNGGSKCVVEIRSLNHRFLEMNLRMPSRDFAVEKKIKDLISGKVQRGYIEVSISISNPNGVKKRLVADEELVKQFLAAAEKIKTGYGVKGEVDLAGILSLKDILRYEEEETDPDERWVTIEKGLKQALGQLVEMRASEGIALQKDVLENLGAIEESTARILSERQKQEKDIVDKLKKRVEEITGGSEVDPQRVLTEVAIIAERSDISEEVIRTRSHLGQLRELVNSGGSVGRKVEFILQEINREANTIGSKSALYDISREVVEIKSRLEKIREQAANIE